MALSRRGKIAATGIGLFVLGWLAFGSWCVGGLIIGYADFSRVENGRFFLTRHPSFGYYEVPEWVYWFAYVHQWIAHGLFALGVLGFGVAFFASPSRKPAIDGDRKSDS